MQGFWCLAGWRRKFTTIADLPISANQRGGKFSTADINRQCGHSTAFFIAVLYH